MLKKLHRKGRRCRREGEEGGIGRRVRREGEGEESEKGIDEVFMDAHYHTHMACEMEHLCTALQ